MWREVLHVFLDVFQIRYLDVLVSGFTGAALYFFDVVSLLECLKNVAVVSKQVLCLLHLQFEEVLGSRWEVLLESVDLRLA